MLKKLILALVGSSFLLPGAFAAGDAWEAKTICIQGKVKSVGAKKGSVMQWLNFDVKTHHESEDFVGCFVAGLPGIARVGSVLVGGDCKIEFNGAVNSDKTVKVIFKVIDQNGASCSVHDAGNNTPMITYDVN